MFPQRTTFFFFIQVYDVNISPTPRARVRVCELLKKWDIALHDVSALAQKRCVISAS